MTGPCHLTIAGAPWCSWSGCAAGVKIASETGFHRCCYRDQATAESAAAALQARFKPDAVAIVAGSCPHETRLNRR